MEEDRETGRRKKGRKEINCPQNPGKWVAKKYKKRVFLAACKEQEYGGGGEGGSTPKSWCLDGKGGG